MDERATIADDLLRGAAEIAAFIGLSERQALHLLKSGRLPGFKIGWNWCMRRSTYTEWVNRREPPMPPSPPAVPASDEDHANRQDDMANTESDDEVEVLTLPPGQYHQRKLVDGRVVLLRRGTAGDRLRVRERQFREIDQRRAQRQNLRLPPEGC
jgi:hypothetical protein